VDANCSETSSSRKTSLSLEDRAVLVTGFGSFGEFEQNPTEVLACGCPTHHVLRVSFSAVDQFLAGLDLPEGCIWVQLGVSAKAKKLTFELAARNQNGVSADVDGITKPGEIEPGPPVLLGTLWDQAIQDSLPFDFEVSSDAGGYLCNYLYYRSLRRFPHARIGFLHVPPETIVPLAELKALLGETLAAVNDQLTA
jgi:pyroglutamyl-peptidase